MIIKGKTYKFKDNINTDEIIPAKYLNTTNKEELAKHCMEGIDKDFIKRIEKPAIVVAGTNFGCGSSREHAPQSLAAAGVACVIAASFARIFYRNSINIGLPILENPEAADKIKEGDEVEINLDSGEVRDITQGKVFKSQKFPEFMQELIKSGGLINWVKKNV